MSFAAHYRRTDRIRAAAAEAVAAGIPRPRAGELLTAAGRARFFARARRVGAKVLASATREAEAAGSAHGREVTKDWES